MRTTCSRPLPLPGACPNCIPLDPPMMHPAQTHPVRSRVVRPTLGQPDDVVRLQAGGRGAPLALDDRLAALAGAGATFGGLVEDLNENALNIYTDGSSYSSPRV